MNLAGLIEPGMALEDHFRVEDEHTAMKVGSGSAPVLATPWLVAFMERVAHRLVEQHLPEGYSSVGVWVNVRHLAATPTGSLVRAACRITQVEGQRVTFSVQAWDETEQIGEGEHQRVVIEQARFIQRILMKGSSGG